MSVKQFIYIFFIMIFFVGCTATNNSLVPAKKEKITKENPVVVIDEEIVTSFDQKLNLGIKNSKSNNDSISGIGYDFFSKKRGNIKW